ncbi:MAG TPA: cupin domain-containing protein [Gaiellaceae bacterium]|nr:cupin domain-containing protein [Gaiellaceae bacterium]
MQLDDQRPLLTPPGEGEIITERAERTIRILGELDDLIMSWFRYEPGEHGPDPHIHEHHTDAFFVLEGELELSLGPELTTFQARPGTLAAAPPRVVHTFGNASDATVVLLNLHVPSSGFGDHMRGRNPSFDQHDPPPDGGRPLDDAVFTRPDEAETVRHEASFHRILCDLPQLTAIDMTFQPEFEGVDPHAHADHTDAFYVLEGAVEFRVGDVPRVAGPGTSVAAPRGTLHGFRVAGPEPIRLFNVHAPPGGFVDRLRG